MVRTECGNFICLQSNAPFHKRDEQRAIRANGPRPLEPLSCWREAPASLKSTISPGALAKPGILRDRTSAARSRGSIACAQQERLISRKLRSAHSEPRASVRCRQRALSARRPVEASSLTICAASGALCTSMVTLSCLRAGNRSTGPRRPMVRSLKIPGFASAPARSWISAEGRRLSPSTKGFQGVLTARRANARCSSRLWTGASIAGKMKFPHSVSTHSHHDPTSDRDLSQRERGTAARSSMAPWLRVHQFLRHLFVRHRSAISGRPALPHGGARDRLRHAAGLARRWGQEGFLRFCYPRDFFCHPSPGPT